MESPAPLRMRVLAGRAIIRARVNAPHTHWILALDSLPVIHAGNWLNRAHRCCINESSEFLSKGRCLEDGETVAWHFRPAGLFGCACARQARDSNDSRRQARIEGQPYFVRSDEGRDQLFV